MKTARLAAGAQAPLNPAPSVLDFFRDAGQQGWGFLGNQPCCSPSSPRLLLAGTAAIVAFPGGNKETAVARSTGKAAPCPVAATSFPGAVRCPADAADCQWVDPESALGEGALLIAGQKLELASGQVEIVFQSGAEVKLHGPAIFEIQSANSSFLTIGRLSARAATPESHGFTVHSRTAATVDLGTEFNVVASEDGHSQIRRRRGGGRGAIGQRAPAAAWAWASPSRSSRARRRSSPGSSRARHAGFQVPHDRAAVGQRLRRRLAGACPHQRAPRPAPRSTAARSRCSWTGRGNPSADSPAESFFFDEQ